MANINVPSSRRDGGFEITFGVREKVCSVLLVVYFIQFSGAWFWGGIDLDSLNQDGSQPYGVPFRYFVWTSIFLGTIFFLSTQPYRPFWRTLLPLLPFWCMGLVSGMHGIDLGTSLRILIFWALMACGATFVALTLRPQTILKILSYTCAAILALSCVISIALPEAGQQLYDGGLVWRGAFGHKNGLGALAMWSIVIAFFAFPTIGKPRAGLLFALTFVCLIMSGSKGSLAVAIGAVAYFSFLSSLIKARLTSSLGIGLLLGGVTVGVIAILSLWLPITSALGRDATLTGRTVIWSVYIEQILHTWFIGEGPGSFSGSSAITQVLFYELMEFGAIRQPHNAFIAAFGDGGIVGLILYVSGLFYLCFVAPFQMRTPESLACAVCAFLVIMGGMVEGRGVYSASLDCFLMLMFHGLAVRSMDPKTYMAEINR